MSGKNGQNGQNTTAIKEPFVRIAKRDYMPRGRAWTIRGISLLLSLVVCGFLIYAIVKMNPVQVYITMWDGAFGSTRRIWSTARDMMMLLCVGVALAPAFKMKFWNIGAEGQILVGGVASAAVMMYLSNLPTPLLCTVMFIASAVAGAVWGLIPAAFKAKFDTNETLFTLMMNYVAIQITAFCVSKWENPYGSNTVGLINSDTKAGWLPAVFGQQYMLNVIIVMAITIIIYIYMNYTKQGYEITVVGDSENTARYAGIDVKKVIIRTMIISGAIAGVSGFIAVSGASHTISTATAGGRGFTAIIVAWLAKFNTIGMIAISLLLVFLDKGAIEIATMYNLNDYASKMVTGIILFFILGSEFFINYRMIFRAKQGKEA